MYLEGLRLFMYETNSTATMGTTFIAGGLRQPKFCWLPGGVYGSLVGEGSYRIIRKVDVSLFWLQYRAWVSEIAPVAK